MPCGWEGNRWSGVALAMRHSLDREMSTPPIRCLVEYGRVYVDIVAVAAGRVWAWRGEWAWRRGRGVSVGVAVDESWRRTAPSPS